MNSIHTGKQGPTQSITAVEAAHVHLGRTGQPSAADPHHGHMTDDATPRDAQLAMVAALSTYAQALIDTFAEQWRQLQPVLQPLIDAYEADPEAFEAAIAEERARESCHCLCGLHSEAKGVCMGEADPGLYRVIHSPTLGRVEVATCRPCLDAVALAAVRDVPLADVLSLTTGLLLSRRRPPADGLSDLVAHLHDGEDVDPSDVLGEFDRVRDEVLRQHPQLVDVTPPPGADKLDLMTWLIEQERVHGETLRIASGPNGA